MEVSFSTKWTTTKMFDCLLITKSMSPLYITAYDYSIHLPAAVVSAVGATKWRKKKFDCPSRNYGAI